MKLRISKKLIISALCLGIASAPGVSLADIVGSLAATSTQNVDVYHVDCPTGQNLRAWLSGSTAGTSLSYASLYQLPYARCFTGVGSCVSQAVATPVNGVAINAGIGIPANRFVVTLAQTTAAVHNYTVKWHCNNGAAQAGAGTAIINQ